MKQTLTGSDKLDALVVRLARVIRSGDTLERYFLSSFELSCEVYGRAGTPRRPRGTPDSVPVYRILYASRRVGGFDMSTTYVVNGVTYGPGLPPQEE